MSNSTTKTYSPEQIYSEITQIKSDLEDLKDIKNDLKDLLRFFKGDETFGTDGFIKEIKHNQELLKEAISETNKLIDAQNKDIRTDIERKNEIIKQDTNTKIQNLSNHIDNLYRGMDNKWESAFKEIRATLETKELRLQSLEDFKKKIFWQYTAISGFIITASAVLMYIISLYQTIQK